MGISGNKNPRWRHSKTPNWRLQNICHVTVNTNVWYRSGHLWWGFGSKNKSPSLLVPSPQTRSNQSSSVCFRFNENGIDLNRNFPDAFAGLKRQRQVDEEKREAEVRSFCRLGQLGLGPAPLRSSVCTISLCHVILVQKLWNALFSPDCVFLSKATVFSCVRKLLNCFLKELKYRNLRIYILSQNQWAWIWELQTGSQKVHHDNVR